MAALEPGALAAKSTGKARVAHEDVKTRRRPTKEQRRADKMEQILDGAELLFSKHGLHGVTLKDVAKLVGVHHTLLNYYFEGQEKAVRCRLCPPGGGHEHPAHGRAQRI